LAYSYNTLIAVRFANEEALAEIRRVLKPGAKLGMIWNIEDCMQFG
jgi:ubiquinone/menaquinone biosynthesis C-methylase UbiE